MNLEGLNVLIIGPPASGKTYFANKLKADNPHKIINTDDYLQYGNDGLYYLLNELKNIHTPTIIEGVLGYRLLRKGVELNCYYPDLVLELEVSESKLQAVYNSERIGKDFNGVKSMIKANQKILAEYKSMDNKYQPYWIKVNNEY